MTRFIDWSAPAPAQHIGQHNWRYETQRVGGPYLCERSTEHRDYTRFAIWQGDHSGPGSERVELDGYQQLITNGSGKELWVAFTFMIEPENITTANWTILGQIHAAGSTSAANFELRTENGGHELRFVLHYKNSTNPADGYDFIYIMQKHDLVYGQEYSAAIRFANPDPMNGTGTCQLWFGEHILDANGTPQPIPLIYTYNGTLGMGYATGYYWKYGIYRQDNYAGTPLAVRYYNMEVLTGSLLSRTVAPLPIVRILPSVL